MKVREAEKLVCPFMSASVAVDHQLYREGGLIHTKCIVSECMAWVDTTEDSVKVIDSYKIPYETYPSDAGDKHRQLIADGFVEIKDKRDYYEKYSEKAEQGYCKRLQQ